MSTADYLSLLDWTARQTRKDKRGATPKKIAPIFDRLGILAEIWCRLVKDFGKLFSVVASLPVASFLLLACPDAALPNSVTGLNVHLTSASVA